MFVNSSYIIILKIAHYTTYRIKNILYAYYQIWKRSAKYTLTNFQIFGYINQITTSFGGIDLQMILKNIVKKATKDLKSLDVIAKPIKHINA